MNASSLSSITAEYIKSITNNGVFSRGLSYFRSGRVLKLKYHDGELAADVSGSEPFPYEVSIHADNAFLPKETRLSCPQTKLNFKFLLCFFLTLFLFLILHIFAYLF